mmetsp:Transcript_12820/g.21764  ORF Transcript_12820/g.21764 Transcript_12820/m.21764 type:complete len:92 (-) Transcript_12820:295-570(-)|eukprot:CAMPEP_0198205822 /NCGR_PEP_ID=MMETSP1445-20131203/9350_1 /TAXON_ID=36898 /ORGANISM="Pyramimonas sp., Strain CCMP2087" /LENGTH=91 /DNA_ID=CAMNT_0043878273 /DNA_START=143 /DNA_END=418 /DNA_ORIENTATION=-
MPWSTRDGTIFAVGAMFTASAVVAFKRKATTPFKIAYFFAWPTLGSGTILLMQPDRDALEKKLRSKGMIDDASMDEARRLRAAQMEALRKC